MALPISPTVPRLGPCPLHWSRPGGPLGHTLIPRVILAKCRRAVAGIVKHRELLAPGIEVGDTVVIDSAERDPGTGQVIACTLNGRDHLRIYHRMGNGRVVLRLAPHDREAQIAVRKADTLVIHGVVVGVVCGRTGTAFVLTSSEPLAC